MQYLYNGFWMHRVIAFLVQDIVTLAIKPGAKSAMASD